MRPWTELGVAAGVAAVLALDVLVGAGCYFSHATAGSFPVEIGSGLREFEPIPVEGAVLPLLPHPRGAWGVALSIRVRGLDPSDAAATCTVRDTATGELLAAPRLDEPHRWTREGAGWVSAGTYALLTWDIEPAELDGRMVRVEATLVTRAGEAFSDARLVTLELSED